MINSGALIKAPLPDFLTTQWPYLHQRIADTGQFDAFGEQPGVPKGPNHVRATAGRVAVAVGWVAKPEANPPLRSLAVRYS